MPGSAELVIVLPQRPQRDPGPLESLLSAVGVAASTVAVAVDRAVSGAVNETLNRVVPGALALVLDRLDLTRMVLDRVPLVKLPFLIDLMQPSRRRKRYSQTSKTDVQHPITTGSSAPGGDIKATLKGNLIRQ